MAFGQAKGPPASAKQVAQLVELLAAAGYESFREARHPLGLTQRQSNGSFTRDEASELIERLEADAGAGDVPPAPPPRAPARRSASSARKPAPGASRGGPGADDVVTAFPDELLADELVRRGWICTPPG